MIDITHEQQQQQQQQSLLGYGDAKNRYGKRGRRRRIRRKTMG